jgi:hypothetical protein
LRVWSGIGGKRGKDAEEACAEREESEEQELQGHVLVALGKLALNDSSLASKVASLFLRELEFSPSAVQRNNLLIILTGMCVCVCVCVCVYVYDI